MAMHTMAIKFTASMEQFCRELQRATEAFAVFAWSEMPEQWKWHTKHAVCPCCGNEPIPVSFGEAPPLVEVECRCGWQGKAYQLVADKDEQ